MTSQKVLICGAGVSGCILAFWLAKHGFEVVVVERSKAGQKLGQGIEIEEPAIQVVKAMGILPELESRKTGEMGFKLVDEKGRSRGFIPVGDFSPTGKLELMRGDETEVLYKAADKFDNVTFRFETVIETFKETQDRVVVDLKKRHDLSTTAEEFDFVIGADGARSRTREILFGNLNCLKPVGAFVAYFSIPKQDGDWPNSKICHFDNHRIVWLRPVGPKSMVTSVYLIHLNNNVPALRQANAARDRTKQKEAFANIYQGCGWETSRVIEKMMEADNFYSDELEQVILPTWSQGRVALLGDAAWAPTPFTGQGNQLAIIGPWVLAQEMSRNRTIEAFQRYEKRLRPYVEESQKIPLYGYMPYICCPKTYWGIWLFRITFTLLALAIQFISWTGIASKLLSYGDRKDEFNLEMDETRARKEAISN